VSCWQRWRTRPGPKLGGGAILNLIELSLFGASNKSSPLSTREYQYRSGTFVLGVPNANMIGRQLTYFDATAAHITERALSPKSSPEGGGG
jgi:hypothetical protein